VKAKSALSVHIYSLEKDKYDTEEWILCLLLWVFNIAGKKMKLELSALVVEFVRDLI